MQPPSISLGDLLEQLEVLDVDGEASGVEITAVAHDSRAVGPGALFCCLPGGHSDGHDHAPEAVARGAVAVLGQRFAGVGVPQVHVADARRQMGRAAAALWGHPSRRLQVAGVTGTNGKTTTTWLLRAMLEAAGRPAGVIGTLGGPRTTPESTELQATLAALAEAGSSAVAMEVSSQGLAMSRVEGTWFSVAVFTNLSPEHLNLHGSMEEYFSVKASLFEPERSAVAVINADDPHGLLLAERARVPVRLFSSADVDEVDIGFLGSTCTWRGRRMHVPFGGAANLSNALAAASAAVEMGVDDEAVVEGLATAPPVPGRYQRVDRGQPFTVVVDYGHTADALEQLLVAARKGTGPGGRVVAVFGCGGDRDRDKRPVMGRVAAELADWVVLTDDNPRDEDPGAILAQVAAGAEGPAVVDVEPDRRCAIRLALAAARPGDVVLVAGKGHETTQVVGGRSFPFDDREVVGEELAALGLGA
ncbi:MAG: UDP-N-acetylmuramoyl-L-alanyl-D-glutamate--2,6-diaminopimelate ligase [Acidimicrobiales bacterium]